MTETELQAVAQRKLAEYRRQFQAYGENAMRLAYHAALPVALTPELLHLIRINFFLDPQDEASNSWQPLPYWIEFDFLVSPLCHQVDEGLYEIDPILRDMLLEGLVRTYRNTSRVDEIATLLWQYTAHHSNWEERVGLERAQQLTALAFLAPDQASDWLEHAESEAAEGKGVEREWYVIMRQGVERQQRIISDSDNGDELDLEVRRDETELDDENKALQRIQEISHEAEEHKKRGNFGIALPLYQEILDLQGRLTGESSIDFAHSSRNLANVYYRLNCFEEAISLHEKSRQVYREIGNIREEARTLGRLGDVCISLGDYQRAIDFYQQELAVCQEIGYRRGEASAFGGLGHAFTKLGEYPRAIDCYQQQLLICQKFGRDLRGKASALGGLGDVYANLSDFQRAIDCYQQGLDIHQRLGDRLQTASTLGHLGNVYAALGEHQQAISFYERELAICQEIGDRHEESRVLGNLGSISDRLNNREEAVQLYELQLRIALEIGNHQQKEEAQSNIDRIRRQNRSTEASLMLDSTSRMKLRQAIVSAYPNISQLEVLIKNELNITLNEIAPTTSNLNNIIILNLIQWAERQGRLDELIQAFMRDKPGNQLISNIVVGIESSQRQFEIRDSSPERIFTSADRLTLIRSVNSLVPSAFDTLVFALQPPKGVLPSSFAPQGQRAKALLDWVTASAGPGLSELEKILNELLPNQIEESGAETKSVSYRYDAFISYRRQEPDKAFARWLLKELKAAGYRVAFDEVDFSPQETFLSEMERCCRESRLVLAVISPRYFESGNTDMEATITTVQGMSDRNIRLIPLIFEKVQRPIWMDRLVGLNFTEEDPLVPPLDRLKAAMGHPLFGTATADSPASPPLRRSKLTTAGDERASDFNKRRQLFQRLSSLPIPQFSPLVFMLNLSNGSIPGSLAPLADRVAALLSWADGPDGCGLDAVEAALDKILGSELMQKLSGLPNPQFEQVVFTLQPPDGSMPESLAPIEERVAALLNWAEGPDGCGLDTVKEVLEAILNPDESNIS